MVDERIKQGQQKIWSEMGRIMYFLATGSFLLKCLALHKSLEDCIIEFLIIVGVPVYHLIRSWQLKLSFLPANDGKGRRSQIRTLAFRLAVVAVIFAVYLLQEPQKDWKEVLIYILSFLAAFQACRMFILFIERKRADKLEEEYDDEP